MPAAGSGSLLGSYCQCRMARPAGRPRRRRHSSSGVSECGSRVGIAAAADAVRGAVPAAESLRTRTPRRRRARSSLSCSPFLRLNYSTRFTCSRRRSAGTPVRWTSVRPGTVKSVSRPGRSTRGVLLHPHKIRPAKLDVGGSPLQPGGTMPRYAT